MMTTSTTGTRHARPVVTGALSATTLALLLGAAGGAVSPAAAAPTPVPPPAAGGSLLQEAAVEDGRCVLDVSVVDAQGNPVQHGQLRLTSTDFLFGVVTPVLVAEVQQGRAVLTADCLTDDSRVLDLVQGVGAEVYDYRTGITVAASGLQTARSEAADGSRTLSFTGDLRGAEPNEFQQYWRTYSCQIRTTVRTADGRAVTPEEFMGFTSSPLMDSEVDFVNRGTYHGDGVYTFEGFCAAPNVEQDDTTQAWAYVTHGGGHELHQFLDLEVAKVVNGAGELSYRADWNLVLDDDHTLMNRW